MDNLWLDISPVHSQSRERTDYPTQKPLALLERIIKASSNPGDVVFDPFCGCATACIAAERLGRQWIGIDISAKAHELVIDRMRREVSLGDADAPALFGSVTCLTRPPRRTDADAPAARPTSRTFCTKSRMAVAPAPAAATASASGCWKSTTSSPVPKAAPTLTATSSSSAVGATAPKAPAATNTCGNAWRRRRRSFRSCYGEDYPV